MSFEKKTNASKKVRDVDPMNPKNARKSHIPVLPPPP